jgi:hypothetical protein
MRMLPAHKWIAFVSIIGFVTAIGLADDKTDKIDNPLYSAWSNFQPNASATYEGDVESSNGEKSHVKTSITLIERTADGMKIQASVGDGNSAAKSDSKSIPAKVAAGDARHLRDEDVTAMGKNFKCKVFEIKSAAAGEEGDDTATVYLSDDVPGGMVKMVFHTQGEKDQTLLLTASNK